MNKKNDHNPKLIFTVKDVTVTQTKSIPPRTLVTASGEAGTNATNPRLVRCALVSIPETLQLDLEADDGLLQVITPVTATFEIEGPHGYNEVTVHAATNSITREVPSDHPMINANVAPDHTVHQHKTQFPESPVTAIKGQTIKFNRHSGRTSFATITAQAGLFAAGEVTICEGDEKTVYANPTTPTDYSITCDKEPTGPGGVDTMSGTIRVGTGGPPNDDDC